MTRDEAKTNPAGRSVLLIEAILEHPPVILTERRCHDVSAERRRAAAQDHTRLFFNRSLLSAA
jgi:hypothetical protein